MPKHEYYLFKPNILISKLFLKIQGQLNLQYCHTWIFVKCLKSQFDFSNIIIFQKITFKDSKFWLNLSVNPYNVYKYTHISEEFP